jgi:two-component system sensor histidine kinase CiaH
MEKLSRQFAAWATRLKADEFFIARLKLTFFYSLTAVVILGGSSLILYKLLLSNLTDSIEEGIADPGVSHAILDRTQDILQNRFILVNTIIVFFVIIIGFLLTRKTLKPIKESMERQKRFVADASHELRTPVAIAISGIEVALRNKSLDFNSAKKTLENTLVEMREFSQLSNTLLDISKYDTNRKIEYADTPIDEVIRSIASKMSQFASDKGVMIETNVHSSVLIKGNKTELDRVFYNILNNAIVHTPQGGRIVISDSISSHTYAVTITDTGSGISKDILDKIFDPFFRGDISRSTEGAGLGLTITKKIVENHSGTITIKSQAGKGTTVIVTLPLSSQ